MRDALRAAAAPVVAVSPIVGGAERQGPDDGLPALGRASSRRAPASPRLYGDVLDGLVADDARRRASPSLQTDTLMADPEARRRVAAETLEFARALRP